MSERPKSSGEEVEVSKEQVKIPQELIDKRDQLTEELKRILDDPELRLEAEEFHRAIQPNWRNLYRPFDI